MALLNKLKSILGIGGSRDGDEQTATSVTVEREGSDRAEPDGDASETDESASDEPTSDEAVAAGTDAAASTGSMTETDEPETETVTETAEAAGPPTEPVDDEPVDRDVEDVIDEAEDPRPPTRPTATNPNPLRLPTRLTTSRRWTLTSRRSKASGRPTPPVSNPPASTPWRR